MILLVNEGERIFGMSASQLHACICTKCMIEVAQFAEGINFDFHSHSGFQYLPYDGLNTNIGQ